MKISRELYQEMQNQTAPKPKVITLFQWLFSSVDSSAPSVNYCCTSMHSSVLIKLLRLPLLPLPLSVAACSSTGLGWYEKIAKHAGAGTLVPITGFANAVSCCAIESRAEGWILGVGAKIFTIAGPVIVYGTAASMLYGLIYYLATLGNR